MRQPAATKAHTPLLQKERVAEAVAAPNATTSSPHHIAVALPRLAFFTACRGAPFHVQQEKVSPFALQRHTERDARRQALAHSRRFRFVPDVSAVRVPDPNA